MVMTMKHSRRIHSTHPRGQTADIDRSMSERDVLPWADPYILSLIAAHESALASEPWRYSDSHAQS